MTVLKVHNLQCGYDYQKPVLRGISFEVKAGEFVGIVGANGCGKTTLLKALTGLLKVHYGAIIVAHHDLTHLERREIAKRLALVPQMMEPVSGFTVEELVMLGRTPYLERFAFEKNDDYNAVKWAMDELDVQNLKDRFVTTLSGGEFQRVAIARALAQEPKVLLLDEPISHLDIRYQVKICKLLRKLRVRRSVVATFHDLNIAARYCNRIILMKKGQIIAEGPPDQVITQENIWKAYRVKVAVRRNPRTHRAKYIVLP